MDNLLEEEILLIELGAYNCWPNQHNTGVDEIHRALTFVLQTIPGLNEVRNTTATQCYCKLIVKVQPDRYDRAGFRVAYASAVCTALLNRCQAALEHSKIVDALSMPRMLITQFSLANR